MDVTDWPAFMTRLRDAEMAWMRPFKNPDSPHLENYIGWLPYSLPKFVMYLTEAVAAAPPGAFHWSVPVFLEVGAGIGTKTELAAALFGLDASGIEIVPEYVAAAQKAGRQVTQADARTFTGYQTQDIIYLNRPLAGAAMASLDEYIMDEMRPGAVLISVNACTRPSDCGWDIISEEWDSCEGVWRKPA